MVKPTLILATVFLALQSLRYVNACPTECTDELWTPTEWISNCGRPECNQVCSECRKWTSGEDVCTAIWACNGQALNRVAGNQSPDLRSAWKHVCETDDRCYGCTMCYLSDTEEDVVYNHVNERHGDELSFDVIDCTEYSKSSYANTMQRTPPISRLRHFHPDGTMIVNHASTSWGDWWNSGTPMQKHCKANVNVLAQIENATGWFLEGENEKINIWDETFTLNRPFLQSDEDWKHAVCYAQHAVCSSIEEYNEDLSGECVDSFKGCQAAFRHLHKMMFRPESKQQQCNNFALKCIRGFFHDSMTSWVEGSILYETELEMNLGLCRWAQYVSVLSDQTQCDPGSIITMAGILGYQACGVNMYDHKESFHSAYMPLRVNRPHRCTPNTNPLISNDENHKKPLEKKSKFSDIKLMAKGKRNEEFWVNMMEDTDFFSRYYLRVSATASLHGHAIGRVTCPQALENTKVTGDGPNVTGGFWDESRMSRFGALGTTNLKTTAQDTIDRLSRTQCDRRDMTDCMETGISDICNGLINSMMQDPPIPEEDHKATLTDDEAELVDWQLCADTVSAQHDSCTDLNNGPTRLSRDIDTSISDGWEPNHVEPFDNETNANVEAAWCDLPHRVFPEVVGLPVDGDFFIWKSIYTETQTSRPSLEFILLHNVLGTKSLEVDYREGHSCKQDLWLSIPFELKRLHEEGYPEMPVSPALLEFESIAWDGIGTLDSHWDSCETECVGSHPLEANRMCTGAVDPGLSTFSFDDYDCSERVDLWNCARNVDAQRKCVWDFENKVCTKRTIDGYDCIHATRWQCTSHPGLIADCMWDEVNDVCVDLASDI